MRIAILTALASVAATGAGMAASAVNLDSEPRTIAVTESGTQTEIIIPAGGSVEFCPAGCFVRMPDGDVEVLTGFELIEISGGQGRKR
jgi:ferredoxin-like protein FixX